MSEKCSLCGAADAAWLVTKRGCDLVRCGGCGLIRRDPMPGAEEVAALYAPASGYQRHRIQSDRNRYDAWTRRRDTHLAAVVGRPPAGGGRLLDAGCATGTFLVDARALGWQVQGIESGGHLVTFGREAYQLDITEGGVEDVGARFAADSFDVVTMWDVVEHLRDPLRVLKQLLYVLKPGGRLWIATPNEDGWVARFHWRVVKPLAGVWPHPEPPRHLYQFSRRTITRLYEQAGFSRVTLVADEIPLWYTSGFAGVPGVGEWMRGEAGADRALYAVTLPVFMAARVVGRGDSTIACGVRP